MTQTMESFKKCAKTSTCRNPFSDLSLFYYKYTFFHFLFCSIRIDSVLSLCIVIVVVLFFSFSLSPHLSLCLSLCLCASVSPRVCTMIRLLTSFHTSFSVFQSNLFWFRSIHFYCFRLELSFHFIAYLFGCGCGMFSQLLNQSVVRWNALHKDLFLCLYIYSNGVFKW